MTTEQLAVIRALVAAHPGEYAVIHQEATFHCHASNWLRAGDGAYLSQVSAARVEEVRTLCALANAVPGLLGHVERLGARP
jgi:hypothetical protein